jgi:hypothetical protein
MLAKAYVNLIGNPGAPRIAPELRSVESRFDHH